MVPSIQAHRAAAGPRPVSPGRYRVVLKVSWGLTTTRATYRDGRWYGLPGNAAVVGFVPLADAATGSEPKPVPALAPPSSVLPHVV